MVKSFAVFGLGKFGKSLALSLMDAGAEVMVVDRSEEAIAEIADDVTYAVVADVAEISAIKSLGLSNMDGVIISMGHDLEASIMSVMYCKELGVPFVLAKARDTRMGDILTKIGADKIVYPEEESGVRTAKKLVAKGILEFFEIADDVCVVEMLVRDEWIGHSLIELNLRRKHNINVIAIKKGNELTNNINPEAPFEEGTTLLITIDRKNLDKLS